MIEFIAMYVIGFVALAIVFGWLAEPSREVLVQGLWCCALWPLTVIFICVAGLLASLRDSRP